MGLRAKLYTGKTGGESGSLPCFFFLRESFSRSLLSERLEQASIIHELCALWRSGKRIIGDFASELLDPLKTKSRYGFLFSNLGGEEGLGGLNGIYLSTSHYETVTYE